MSIHNLVVVGGRNANPARLKTRLDPMKLEDGMGIAATSIAFGEMFNINASNNNFAVGVTRTYSANEITRRPTRRTVWESVSIPKGRYTIRKEIFYQIYRAINDYLIELDQKDNNVPQRCTYDANDKANDALHIDLPSNKFTIIDVIVLEDHGPWSLINAYKVDDVISMPNATIEEVDIPNEMGFIYMNIVENSLINGEKSRLLSVFPIETKAGYTYFQFQHPIYVPIEVKEFSEIDIELRGIKGRLLDINRSFDTVISMHIKPINRTN